MKLDVTIFVNFCSKFQQTKHTIVVPFGLLQPLLVLNQVWEDVSLDLEVWFPYFQSLAIFLDVVDR